MALSVRGDVGPEAHTQGPLLSGLRWISRLGICAEISRACVCVYWAVDEASVVGEDRERTSPRSWLNAANNNQSVSLNDLVVASCTFSNTCWDARVERSMNSLVCSVA